MKKLALLLSVSLASCSVLNLNLSKDLYKPTSFVSIEAFDLSEDATDVSSKNDEVLVSVYFCHKDAPEYVTSQWHSDIKTFKVGTVHSYNRTLMIPDSGVVYICLTEIDDEEILDKTKVQITEYLKYKKDLAFESKTTIDAMIKDNDYLGHVKLNHQARNSETLLNVLGVDLLDKYHYKVKVEKEMLLPQ
jgi:hypothetical protein